MGRIDTKEYASWENGIDMEQERILELIRDIKNPYPKDIFQWDNKEKLDFNRGRFNRHCFEVVENIRGDILKLIKDED